MERPTKINCNCATSQLVSFGPAQKQPRVPTTHSLRPTLDTAQIAYFAEKTITDMAPFWFVGTKMRWLFAS